MLLMDSQYKGPVMQSSDGFFSVILDKLLSIQLSGHWNEIYDLSHMWCHPNVEPPICNVSALLIWMEINMLKENGKYKQLHVYIKYIWHVDVWTNMVTHGKVFQNKHLYFDSNVWLELATLGSINQLLNQHWFQQWFGNCKVPSHCWNQWEWLSIHHCITILTFNSLRLSDVYR